MPGPIAFTRHARNRMRRDCITPEVITSIVGEPEATTPAKRGHYHAWGHYRVARTQTDWLRVTVAEEPDTLVIITVVPHDRGPARR